MGDTLYRKMDDDDVKMLPDRYRVEQVKIMIKLMHSHLEQENIGWRELESMRGIESVDGIPWRSQLASKVDEWIIIDFYGPKKWVSNPQQHGQRSSFRSGCHENNRNCDWWNGEIWTERAVTLCLLNEEDLRIEGIFNGLSPQAIWANEYRLEELRYHSWGKIHLLQFHYRGSIGTALRVENIACSFLIA